MTRLEIWLRQATRNLSRESTARVRGEIEDHYESAREAAIHAGATAEEADRAAVDALGDAKTANCQYRHVLLTAAEASMLRQGNREARLICSRRWLPWSLTAVPLAAFLAAVAFFVAGANNVAWSLVMGGSWIGLLFVAPLLPIFTPSRGRAFRWVKWVLMVATLAMAFNGWWLTISCLWPLAWVEWTRISIRRKLPVAEWPKQLYL